MSSSRHHPATEPQRGPRTASASSASSMQSSPPSVPLNIPYRHAAVRQSSLLRFAQNVRTSSSPSTAQSETHLDYNDGEYLLEPHSNPHPRRRKNYRPRSHTYPYVESEADDTVSADALNDYILHSSPPDAVAATMPLPVSSARLYSTSHELHITQDNETRSPGSSSLRPEAEPFIPTALAPLSPTTRSYSPAQTTLPDRTRRATPYPFNIPARSSSSLAISSPQSDGLPAAPITPPQAEAPTQMLDPSTDSPVSLPKPPPSTPAPSLPRNRPARTDPRTLHRQSRQGSSISIYNDSLPAAMQPQTPADLSRGQILTEYEAAYTAPPGMMGMASAGIPRRHAEGGGDGTLEPGEQSPTVRSARMRQWRGRELRRSVRVEAVRMRQDFVDGLNRDQSWRQDLDEHRVGEENFAEAGGM